uniref:Uncharacterized protein n=1 Tax=Meloidogyne enterolobii TaxID=390850 RepID=A0A6V7VD06_MELEN|nr:unnamed protein product [Meloidogyne enterolobii]
MEHRPNFFVFNSNNIHKQLKKCLFFVTGLKSHFYLDHKNGYDASINDKTNEIGNLLFESGEINGTSPKFLRLQFQQYPQTIEEMLIFRHWLKKPFLP